MKNQLRLFTMLFSLIAFGFTNANLSYSQTILFGKVLDSSNLEGIISAQVAVYKNNVFVCGTITDLNGNYKIENIEPGTYDLEAFYTLYPAVRKTGVLIKHGESTEVNFQLSEGVMLDEVVIVEYKAPLIQQACTTQGKKVTVEQIRSMPTKNIAAISATSAGLTTKGKNQISVKGARTNEVNYYVDGVRINNFSSKKEEDVKRQYFGNEEYKFIPENEFVAPQNEPLSTFSIDVDRAGYSNVRRFIDNGVMPPIDAIRIEEMVNYFDYDYSQPKNSDPIALHSTLTSCPWNKEHELLHVGLKGKALDLTEVPRSNLVFLIDVSGSMGRVNKLPLVKSSFKMLLNKLREDDRVAIVTYAGNASVALESTTIAEKKKILQVLESLGSGGSTAGAQGIQSAYQIAEQNFIKNGNNRVILATDGDFNVGIRDVAELEAFIEKKKEGGVFLSVLGFGIGNYKDHKMQTLADKGNGNHAYIDNIQEARKVLISEFSGTLFTIAKDVKLQIEFNPEHVLAYRLIGYENRMLEKEDFNDDSKDAGELGAGHVVTAIYEIIKSGSQSVFNGKVDPLKYQKNKRKAIPVEALSDELATIKFRYKKPEGRRSKKVVSIVSTKSTPFEKCKADLRFSIAVAQFGLLLRQSKFIETGSYQNVVEIAQNARGEDLEGYRAEFIRLVKSVKEMEASMVSEN